MSRTVLSRVDELQADRALWGLDPEADRELADLLARRGRGPDTSWERCAAVATLALQDDDRGPPPALLERLRAGAPVPLAAAGPHRRRFGAVSSLLAAAVLILSLVVLRRGTGDRIAPGDLRGALLQAGSASLWKWQQAEGDVVWDPHTQRGVMRFLGLPANDPSRRQYQLWIVDRDRNPDHPVDGGVFDIPSGPVEAVIPIHAKLAVRTPVAFVVTVEEPGGVVVSQRSQVVAVARPR